MFSGRLASVLKTRNFKLLLRFIAVQAVLVFFYAVIFQMLMHLEGRQFSWSTGFYWTLTTMSTLGYGDVVFTSDIGRLFSIVVLLSGIIFMLYYCRLLLFSYFMNPGWQRRPPAVFQKMCQLIFKGM